MLSFHCVLLGYCDFELDLCSWTNEPDRDKIDWLRTQGGTDSTGTGPSNDHTTGTPLGKLGSCSVFFIIIDLRN